MSFWDGRQWLPTTPPTRPARRGSRARDWAATAGLIIVLAAVMVPLSAALANGPQVSTNPSASAAGTMITVTGVSFPARSTIQLTWDDAATDLPTATVSGRGTFKVKMTVPAGELGPHTISVVDWITTGGARAATKAGQLGAVLATSVFTLATAVSASAAPSPTATPVPEPTSTPVESAVAPSVAPSVAPTLAPSQDPDPTASAAPTASPTPLPTSAPTPSPTATPVPAGGFVTRCGTALCHGGQPWYLYGASQLGGMDDPNARASLAVSAGLNTLRVVNFLDEQGSPSSAPYDEPRWQRVDRAIAAAGTHGLHVLFDLSTYRNLVWNAGANPYTFDWQPFLSFVANRRNTASGVLYRDDPTIALVAFAGEVEPINTSTNARGITTAHVTEFFRRTFAQWKALDPNHLISSGGLLQIDWNSGIDWRAIFGLANSDVCSIHDYSSTDQTVTTPAVAAYCASINRPWITEEFGWEQSEGDAARAGLYSDMYGLQRIFHAAGVSSWNLGTQLGGTTYDFNTGTPLTWNVVAANAP
jgi:hypothetical protein